MVNRNLIRELELGDELNQELELAMAGAEAGEYSVGASTLAVNSVLHGKILRVDNEFVLVDVGYKSEGHIPRNEWDESEPPPQVGDVVKVLLEEFEDGQLEEQRGLITLSKRKARRIEDWLRVMESVHENDVVTGFVTRKIKGGLLVDISGVNVFLPASQVDIRRPADIGEQERAERKKQLMETLEVGQVRRGIVKNIADFGAFVDLGGIDGLLHITDMSWGRIGHPSEMVSIDQEIEVQVLHIDREREKIALGMKQRTASPWAKVADKYPVGTVCKGTVVNVMSYGAFVKLEDGVEGLVHISEMSWTKRVSHPSELVKPGDEVEVVVLAINKEKQEISLGMKQTQQNPWEKVAADYPPGAVVKGVVRNLTNYGAFIEIDDGIDGLLHVTDMSWTRKVTHPSEMVDKGQEIECKVLSVDQQRRRIALGLKQMHEDPWTTDIPSRYKPGDVVKGNVTKITNFGVFVGLEDGLEGLLHISELSEDKVENAEEVVKVGDPIEVKILRVDTDDRKIGLSKKRVGWSREREAAEGTEEV
jgi:small subunit ribosomal protein S1